MKHAMINGTGRYLPKKSLSNYEIEKRIDTSHEWIVSRTGIESRYIADEEETTSFMASEAAKLALSASSIKANDLDLIVVATCTPDNFFPSTACAVLDALQIQKPIPAFDIGAACSGFIYAMDVAKQYIEAGTAKHVMVIGSEKMTRSLDWNDRSTCILFGDGAGAIVFSRSDETNNETDKDQGILASVLHASYDTAGLLVYPNDLWDELKSKVVMRGNEVFKLAVNVMGDIVSEVLEVSGYQQEDIDWLIPHQANIRIIHAIAKKLNLPLERVIVTLENQGNTSAASIPLALDFAIREKRIKRGDLLLLESFGGGMTWGAALVRY